MMNERMLKLYILPWIERHIVPNRRERMFFLLRRGDSDALYSLNRCDPKTILCRESVHPVYFRGQDEAQAVRALRERGAGETVCVVNLFHAEAWERPLAQGVEEVLGGFSMMVIALNGSAALFKGENYDEQYLIY